MWKSNRVIVPAHGWYEWVAGQGEKQPYFIVPIDDEPLFFAGLSSLRPSGGTHEGDGFLTVTDASDAGMLEVHDRRPLVLIAQRAPLVELEHDLRGGASLGHGLGTPVETSRWFLVGKGVNKWSNDDTSFNEPPMARPSKTSQSLMKRVGIRTLRPPSATDPENEYFKTFRGIDHRILAQVHSATCPATIMLGPLQFRSQTHR